MEVLEYLKNHVKTEIAPSPIHGIGTFALTDIEVGESVFMLWPNESRVYTIEKNEFSELPDYSKKMILKSYLNKPEYPVVWFRLFKDSYFNLANPLVYTNTAEENANFDSVKRIAIKPIKAGEEILGNYKLEDTLL
jgi:SET domain-containing protein